MESSFQRSDLATLLPPLRSLTSFSEPISSTTSSPLVSSSSFAAAFSTPEKSPLPSFSSGNDSNSNLITNKDGSEVPDFYVILPDQDFKEKTGGIVKRGIIRAESLKGKFHRKLGSVEVLRHSDALNDNWIRKMYPGPREHMIYRKHPYDREMRYIGVDIFHATLMDEMQNELSQILRTLGAKSVTWEGYPSMNVVYEAPSSMAPYIPPVSDHIFLPHFPSWQTLVKERLNESIDRYTFQFTYLEDFQINDELMSRVLGKMNLSSQERQELFTLHQERHSITSSGHDRNLLSTSISNAQYQSTLPHSKSGVEHLNLFSSLRISIRIEYFSLLDYQNYNRLWIESNWTVNHVITFLRLTSLSFDLEDLFLENEIDGRGLLQLALPVEMMIPLPKMREMVKRVKQKLNEEKMRVFRSKVLKLGSIDYLELLRDVMQEEGRVRAENEKKLEEMTIVRSQFRKQQQQQHNNSNTHQHNSQQQQHTAQTQRTQDPSSAVSSPATPATTVYKFSQLASPNSSSKTRDNVSSPAAAAVTSPSTPIASYSQEEEDRNHHHQQLQQSPSSPAASLSTPRKPQQQEQVTSSRVARGDTLFSEGIFEVVMVGEGAVGKTSLMNRICRDEFHAVEKPTIGTKLLQHALGKLVLDVWDTGGQPAQYATMKARAKRADVILAVYDVSNRDSLIALKDILEDLYQIGMQPWAAVVLIGNKADVMTPLRQISLEEGLVTARDLHCASFFETSAKTGFNTKEALANAVLKCEQGRLDYLTSQMRPSEGSIRLNHSRDKQAQASSSCAC